MHATTGYGGITGRPVSAVEGIVVGITVTVPGDIPLHSSAVDAADWRVRSMTIKLYLFQIII